MTERDYVTCKGHLATWLGGRAQSLYEGAETPFSIRVQMEAVKSFERSKSLEIARAALSYIADHPGWMCYAHTGDEHEGDCAVATARKALAELGAA